jgi:hypothetical protein
MVHVCFYYSMLTRFLQCTGFWSIGLFYGSEIKTFTLTILNSVPLQSNELFQNLFLKMSNMFIYEIKMLIFSTDKSAETN